MSYQTDNDAYILAHLYGFFPWDEGKYEHTGLDEDEEMMSLASNVFRTNILIKYIRAELEE